MTQIGEAVAIALPGDDKQKCVFCQKDHQEEEPAGPHEFPRNMGTLKKDGRKATRENGTRSPRYPGTDLPPLVEWQADISKTGGYKAAAHHCIALKCASKHKLSGEFNEAGYDPNNGNNCCWLPYSKLQFSRARAYEAPLQKHRGGHTNAYFEKVDDHLDKVRISISKYFCNIDKQASKKHLLKFLEVQENSIWGGITSSVMTAYHLYNDSYLDPLAPWGSFDAEKNKSKADVIGAPTPAADDSDAESESAEDPE